MSDGNGTQVVKRRERRIITPGLQSSLYEFGISGQPPLIPVVPDQIGLSVNILDLVDSPFDRIATPFTIALGHASPGGADANVYIIKPEQGTIMQLHQILLENANAAVQRYMLRVATSKEMGSLAGALISTRTCLGLNERTANTKVPITADFRVTTPANATVGTLAASVTIQVGDTKPIKFPGKGITLYGDDKGGIPGFLVVPVAAAEITGIALFGTMWGDTNRGRGVGA